MQWEISSFSSSCGGNFHIAISILDNISCVKNAVPPLSFEMGKEFPQTRDYDQEMHR